MIVILDIIIGGGVNPTKKELLEKFHNQKDRGISIREALLEMYRPQIKKRKRF